MSPEPQPDVLALLTEAVRSLTIGWTQMVAYPPGHPARTSSLRNAHDRLTALTAPAGSLALGVSHDGLVFGEAKIESPQAKKLAQALYRRNVALLRFEEGLEAAELEAFLRLLGDEGGPGAEIPLWDAVAAAGVRHLALRAVDYSAVRVADEGAAPVSAEEEPGSLWDRMLRVLLAGGTLGPEGRDLRASDANAASEIGALLAEHLGRESRGASGLLAPAASVPGAGGRGTAGGGRGASGISRAAPLAVQVAEAVGLHISRARGPARHVSVQQVVELVRALPSGIGQSVVAAAIRAVASDEADAETIERLASSLGPDAVLRSLRQLNAEGVKLSSHALRVAQAMAPPPSPSSGTAARGPEIDAVVGELRVLFTEEDIDRYTPEDHEALFERVAVEVMPTSSTARADLDLGDRLESLTDDAVAERLGLSLLEILVRGTAPPEALPGLLARLEGLFRLFLSTGRLEAAIAVAEAIRRRVDEVRSRGGRDAAFEDCLLRLANPDSVATLVEVLHGVPDAQVGRVQRLIDLLGTAAARSLLFALSEESNRHRRRRLFDLLAALGPVVVPPARELLGDDRWYVVRNMLALLHAVGDHGSLPHMRTLARHPDLRVRLEAIKSLFAFDTEVPGELLEAAVNDPDPKLAESAVTLVGQYGIVQAVDALVALLGRWDLLGRRRGLRLKAIKALSELRDASALPRLGRFFREYRLLALVPLEERRAAFRSLESYPPEARLPILESGMRSRDPEIRQTCERLAALGQAPSPEEEA